MIYNHLDNAASIIEHFAEEVKGIRTGRVNAAVLETINVQAYGSSMKIVELATVTQPEPSQLLVTPFDKGVIPEIIKGINNSNLGVNPVDDGAGIRLVFPPMTEENRAARAKEVNVLLEDARVKARQDRSDTLKLWKGQKDAGEIGEDDLSHYEKQLQDEVEHLNKELEEMGEKKKEEIMKM